ncbi:pyridoxal phosphate-dependent transferase [Aspergillus insuetus]
MQNHPRTDYYLSTRGAHNFLNRDVWGPREKSMGNPWSPENPTGTVNLRLAENSLMHEQIAIQPSEHLTYSTGPRGSLRLRRAAAAFLTQDFHARQAITAENIIVTPGVASAIDGLAWAICDEGDGILIPQPFYNGFEVDILNRSNARVVPVSYTGVDGYSSLDDLFCPRVNRKALEAALNKAECDGINVKALLISHPHNPLGRCYPPETIQQFVSFCTKHSLHFISDEIYAHSVFGNPSIPCPVPFVSVLSLDLPRDTNPAMIHVLYGASKDFCANGLRLGLVYTRNQGIMGAMSSIGIFSWSAHLLQDIWAAMLEDRTWMQSFMSEKRRLMEMNRQIATSFLRECEIEYYETNAGLFLWIDLRHLLEPGSNKTMDTLLSVDSADAHSYKRRETRVAETCMRHGVLIASGHVYAPEEYGWFRLTFTVGEEALKEGLNRFRRAVAVVKGGEFE